MSTNVSVSEISIGRGSAAAGLATMSASVAAKRADSRYRLIPSSFRRIGTNAHSHRLKNPGSKEGGPLPAGCERLYVLTVEFRLLGPLEVERDGGALPL